MPAGSSGTLDARRYRVAAIARDGSPVWIRAIRPDDHDRLLAHFNALSPQSKIFRFHGARRSLSEEELIRLTQVDFSTHVALVATFADTAEAPIVGVGRYIINDHRRDRAEIGCAVLDEHQGEGLGSLLLHHIALIARAQGIREFQAEVMDANQRMIDVFADSGLPIVERASRLGVTHLVLSVANLGPPRWEKQV